MASVIRVNTINSRSGLSTVTFDNSGAGVEVAGIVTATSFSGGLPITNGANNRVITATSSSALTGESALTFDGTMLFCNGGTITAERGAIPSVESKNSTSSSYARFYCSQTSGSGGYAAFQKLGTTSTAIGGANATQIWCTGDAPLVIGVNNAERLRITSTGKVGMGTAANNGPAAPLHIYGGSNTTPILAFTRSSTHDDWQGGGIGLVDEGGTYKGALTFYTHGTSGTKNDSVIERLRITSAGLIQAKTRTASERRMILAGSPSNSAFNIEAHDGATGTSSGTVQGELGLYYNDGSTLSDTATIKFERGSGAPDGAMTFFTNNAEKLRITSGGQLIQTTTHTTGNSAHVNTSWYGDDANHYNIEIRDFNEMYATKTLNTNTYNTIIYKREKMTHNCDIEFMLAGQHDSSGSGNMHLAMTICGDGSDTWSNFDRLVFRPNGGTASSNQIRVDKAGGGSGFNSQGTHVPQFFDGQDRHIQIKIRGRRYSVYSDGVEIATKYSDTDNPRQNGWFGFAIYEASSLNPWIKIRDFKIQNYSLNTSLPSWDVVKSVPASTNNAYH